LYFQVVSTKIQCCSECLHPKDPEQDNYNSGDNPNNLGGDEAEDDGAIAGPKVLARVDLAKVVGVLLKFFI